MELGLSLGGDSNHSTSAKPFGFSTINGPDPLRHPRKKSDKDIGNSGLGLGFCMALGTGPNDAAVVENDDGDDEEDDDQTSSEHTRDDPLQLDLLPRAPVPRRWSSENGNPHHQFVQFSVLVCVFFGGFNFLAHIQGVRVHRGTWGCRRRQRQRGDLT